MNALAFTLRDFSLRENRLADYPSLLSQEHNNRLTVRSVALAHPNSATPNFVKLNIDSVGKADQIKISPEVAFGNSQSYEVMLNLTSQKKKTNEIASPTSHNKS